MLEEVVIAPVTGENMAAYIAHTDQLRERGESQYKFTAQGLTRSDWEALHPQMQEHGYRLFMRKDWTENVEGLRADGIELDEVALNKVLHTIGSNLSLFHAFTLADNTCVALKIIVDNPTSREREVLEYLNTPELRRCPANSTIPLLDSFNLIYGDTLLHVLVMEDCSERPFNEFDTLLQTAEDWYRLMLRIFEGVDFMHSLGIAHLDVHSRNIIGKEGLKSIQDIYIADFGGSQQFLGPVEEALCYHPTYLLDCSESPYNDESPGGPFNPFAVDVYGVGWMFMHTEGIHERFSPPQLLDLLQRMMNDDPQERPTMAEALNGLRKILLETLLYPDKHTRAVTNEDSIDEVPEGLEVVRPVSPEHEEDIAEEKSTQLSRKVL